MLWLLIQSIFDIVEEKIVKCLKRKKYKERIISLPYDSGCCGRCEKRNEYIRAWTFIEIIPNNGRIILSECNDCNNGK
uniref:Uncharacterized protein n=1 Tax=Strongyloides venezuelensis TaxID=75913 RepID=A0A0K0G0D8_STRVS